MEIKNSIKEIESRLGGKIDFLLQIPIKYDQYKSRAKSKKLTFNLTFAEFDAFCKSACYYCKKFDENKPTGIDRLNNQKGYYLGNVVPCCWICNRAKSNMSFKDFKEYLNRFKSVD